ncbi:MAG: PEP-utilizing enzyme [Thermoleophilia bacterium]
MKSYDITPFEFDPEYDLDVFKVLFLDGTHSVPPWKPMNGWLWAEHCTHGLEWACQTLSLPTLKGLSFRLHNGGGYIGIYLINDEEEIAQREEKFRENLVPFLEDYDDHWERAVAEMLGHYARLKETNLDTCTEVELLKNFDDSLDVYKRQWELHFLYMYVVFGVFILFESVCKEWLDLDDTKPEFHKLMSGYDNKIFQIDREMWKFSKLAMELGVDKVILESDSDDYVANLQAHPNGSVFLTKLNAFLHVEGWRGSGCDITVPLWVENPRAPLVVIKQFLMKGGDFSLDTERLRLAAERNVIEAKLLSQLSEDKRDYFQTIMALAQKSGNFSEEHNQYFDLYAHAMVRRVCLGVGRYFVKMGTFDEVEDVFFLNPQEVRKALLTADMHDYRPLVARRKAEWEGWCQNENPPILGDVTMDEAMGVLMQSQDSIMLKVVVGSFPVAKPELKADLYGVSGSPGVVEGVARLVMSEPDLNDLQQGEILVAPATYPSWTPVFGMIKGVVVDRGASLSHAAIVGREYGIPVVMNVMDGSKRITSGMRIRVDGDMGVVYFLDGEAA